MKLSIVIICWNDKKVILDCLASIYAQTRKHSFEIIVSDNGSTDDSVSAIQSQYPLVKIIENRQNLGFAKGNNVGIRSATGEYVLILNPDTVIHDSALDTLVDFADAHPEAGALGCRAFSVDGSSQHPGQPLPTPINMFVSALGWRWLGWIHPAFEADIYRGWSEDTVREIGVQHGFCILVRRELLVRLKGFDQRFFYNFEEVDLCRRIVNAGHAILFCPDARITHLGGQSTGRFPTRFAIEKCRNCYRYMCKHFGKGCLWWIRLCYVLKFALRWMFYTIKRATGAKVPPQRLQTLKTLILWNWRLNPVRFVDSGEEPDLGFAPLQFICFTSASPGE